jgi:hypothetical protein
LRVSGSACAGFTVDTNTSSDEIGGAVAELASVVRKADSYSAAVTTGNTADQAQTTADVLETIVSGLENIGFEVDTKCPVCSGEGAIDCPKGEIDHQTSRHTPRFGSRSVRGSSSR